MNFISILGLVAMLLCAWALSYHRTQVKMRPIFWGMGLQLLFGIIILKGGMPGSVAMTLFAGLLAVFVLREDPLLKGSPALRYLALSFFALAAGCLFYFLNNLLPLWILLLIFLAFLIANPLFLRWAPWQPRVAGLLIIAGMAYLIAENITGKMLFDRFSDSVKYFLSLSDYGAEFMFGNQHFSEKANEFFPGFGVMFAFKVLPTIIFFGGFMSVMYYLGVVQKVIGAMSHFVRWTLGTSGAESLSCTANIFVGQTEAPLLVKPFLGEMTNSELLTVMVGGFATIAGGVLAGYISFGVDAGNLIAASVMSAPAALVIAKIIYPELGHSKTAGDVALPEIDTGENILEAAALGISDGFKLALNVGAMLIGFIALIALLDVMLNWVDGWVDHRIWGGEYVEYAVNSGLSPVTGEYSGIFPGSLKTLFGTVLSPLAWLMGVPWEDAGAVGNLLGMKLTLNEFVAYGSLGNYIHTGALGERAVVISTFALCGFANFSSIGIQLGGISALVPERRTDLAKVVFKAMLGGALASWTTACIAGIFL